MRKATLTTLLCTVLVLASVLQGSPSSAQAALAGPLTTQGNQILDANGSPVMLRGVAREWLNWRHYIESDSHVDEPNMEAKAAWGANVVRVFLGQQFWNSNECEHVSYYKRNVDQVIEWITSRGMLALIDLHWNTRSPCLEAGQKRMADDPGSVLFWSDVAERYKHNALVAFDLYNEPHDIDWNTWRHGGTLQDGLLIWQAAGMQQLYDAVRSTGAENLVFVGGNGWASEPPAADMLLDGYNVVYAVHAWRCVHDPNCDVPDPLDPSVILDKWLPLSETHPVVITEFGWPDNDGTYNQNVIDWAELHNIGWIAYQWSKNESYDPVGLLADWGPAFEPSLAGQPVYNGLQRGS